MEPQAFELNFYFLSLVQRLRTDGRAGAPSSAYKEHVMLFFNLNNIYTTKEKALKQQELNTWEEVIDKDPWRYVYKDDSSIIFDLHENYTVQPQESMYDVFFAYCLSHQSILHIDQFLDYRLKKYHEEDFAYFSRFLQLLLREYGPEGQLIIPKGHGKTVLEWIAIKEKQYAIPMNSKALEGNGSENGKYVRRKNDNLTALNQEQIVLLFQYLEERKVFLPDITDTKIAAAINILTGYSINTVRPDLGKYSTFENHDNLRKVNNLLAELSKLVKDRYPGKSSEPPPQISGL